MARNAQSTIHVWYRQQQIRRLQAKGWGHRSICSALGITYSEYMAIRRFRL